MNEPRPRVHAFQIASKLGFSFVLATALLPGSVVVACGDAASTNPGADTDGDAEATADATTSGDGASSDANASGDGQTSSPGVDGGNALADNTPDHEDPADYAWDAADEVLVSLAHTTITTDTTRATVSGSTVTITSPGTYRVQGTLDDGRILVDTTGLVRLILDGADVRCSTQSPLAVLGADKTIVVLAANTDNALTDGASYTFAEGEDEPNAALFSKDDLTVYGLGGTLTIHANYNDGIGAKDGLVLKDANVVVNAKDDGVRGKDYVVVRGGSLKITAGGDGIKSDEDQDAKLGYVAIASGTLNLVAGGDGIQGETDVIVGGGALTIKAGGGSNATLAADASAKGLKAGVLVEVTAGTIAVDAADDTVHADVDAWIGGGTFTLASGDQGLKVGDTGTLTVAGGEIHVTKSTEGVSGGTFYLEGGSLWIVASDDGFSISRGTDSMSADDGSKLYVHGGYVVIDAAGDGIDVNGSGEMTAGTVLVHGPTANNNAALDTNGEFVVSGGVLVAVGSSGMAMAPSTKSTQNAILVNLTAGQAAGSLVHLQDGAGASLLTFAPAKAYQSVLFSAPSLAQGTSYAFYTGGSATGTPVDGLHADGTYTPGTLAESFTSSTTSSITTVGKTSGGPGGGGPGGGGGGPGGP